jgi:hypothetical protein
MGSQELAMVGSYDYRLVALSVAIAVLACCPGLLIVVRVRFDPCSIPARLKIVTSIQEPFLKIIELFSLDLRHITATRCCASVVALRELNYS